MYITKHHHSYDLELVLKENHWYIKVRLDLNDKRYNHEFIIIKDDQCDQYISNFILIWNMACDVLKKYIDSIKPTKKQLEEYEYLNDFIETDNIYYQCNNGFKLHISLGSITTDQYKIYKKLSTEIDPYFLDDVISFSYYSENYKSKFYIDDFYKFSNYIESLKELSDFAKESLSTINKLKEMERKFFKERLFTEGTQDNYFEKYSTIEHTNFENSGIILEISNEHGSSRY